MSKSQKAPIPLDYASAGPPPLTEDEELRYKQYLYEVSTYGTASDSQATFVAIAGALGLLGVAALLLPHWTMPLIAVAVCFLFVWLRGALINRKWSRFEKDRRP